jgi:hypothetical protein
MRSVIQSEAITSINANLKNISAPPLSIALRLHSPPAGIRAELAGCQRDDYGLRQKGRTKKMYQLT